MAGNKEQKDTKQKDTKTMDPDILRAFEDFLGSAKTDDVFVSILKDYSPRRTIITEPSSQVRIEPATGLGFGTFFKTVGLFFRKPRSTYNLLRFALNQEKYNNPELQKALIGRNALWSFVQNTAAKNLDKVGEMMSHFGIDVFSKGGMLDQEALKSLQSSMTNPDVIQNIKQIALQSIEAAPNYIKITADSLKLVDQSPGFRNYFETKGEAVKSYISNYIRTATETEKSDLNKWKSLDALGKKQFLDSKGYTNKIGRDKILASDELPKGVGSMIADAGITVDDVDKLLDIVPILMKRTGALGDVAEKVDKDNLIDKGNEIISLVAGQRRNPRAIAQILEKLAKGDFIGVAEDSLELIDNTPEMQKYLNDNKEIFGKIIVTSLNENEAFKASGLSGDVVNIVPHLMYHPKELLEIIDAQKKGDFIEVGDKVLKLINEDQQIKNYFAKNTDGIKNFVMTKVKAEVEDQVRELRGGGLPEHNRIAVALNQYGINIDDVSALVEIIPVLMNKTGDLGKILQQFREGKYQELAMDALDMVGPGQEINSYISKNKEIFGKVLESVIRENPIFADVKGNMVDILPILLNDPESLKILVKQGIDNQLTKLPETFLNMLETNKDLRIYLNKNREVMSSVAIKLLNIESYKIPKEVSDVMLNLTNPENISQMKTLASLASKGEWENLIIGTTSMIEKDPAFAQSMKDNKDGFSKLINATISQIPQAKQMLGEAKIGKLGATILADPGSVRSVVEAWQKGSVATAQAVTQAVVKSLMNPEIRNGLTKQASRWWNGVSADNQEVVNSISTALSSRSKDAGEAKVNLSDFIGEAFEEVAKNISDESIKNRLSKKVNKKILFENTSISGSPDNMINFANLDIIGNSFVNTKFSNVSFRNTDLRGVAFNGSSFNNVDFKGASMDVITFASMRDGIIAGKVPLDGVRLIGDFSLYDLSNIDFSKADLSQVTSVNASIITNSSFYDIKHPQDPDILADTFGFREAHFNNEYIITDEGLKTRNAKFAVGEIVDAITYKSANNKDSDVMSKESKQALLKVIEKLYDDDSQVGEKLRQFVAYSTFDLNIKTRTGIRTSGNFPENPKSFKNVADYRDKFSHMLTDIYEHRHDPAKIEEALVADIIAGDVTQKLFGEGANRGQDGLKIKISLMEAVEQYSKINSISPRNILKSSNYDKIVSEIVADIYPRTLSTAMGVAARTGGIQLGPNTINSDIINKFLDHMNIGAGIHEFTRKEVDVIDTLAEKIADNVFGSNSKKNRTADFGSIKTSLEKSIYDIKSSMPGIELDKMLTKHQPAIVGEYNKSGLAKEYYDTTKYFGRGLSDDIHLNSFRNKITASIDKVISEDLQTELKTNKEKLKTNLSSARSDKLQKLSFQEMTKLRDSNTNQKGVNSVN